MKIEVGEKCIATGGEIKKIFAIVKTNTCEGMTNYWVHNEIIANGEYVDLSSKNIDFNEYVGWWCVMYGDFWDKTTSTGKIKKKFLVLRIEKRHREGFNGDR